MKIIELANIFSGILKSREISLTRTDYQYWLIDYSTINNNKINESSLQEIYTKDKLNGSLLIQKNDILVKMLCPILLIYIDKDFSKPTIATSNFAIIRAKENIDSRILFYLLNQNFDLFITNKSTIKTLKISDIRNIDVNYCENSKMKLLTNLEFKLNKQIDLLENKKNLMKKISKYYGEKYGK